MHVTRSSPVQREISEPRQVRKEATAGSLSRVTRGSLTSFYRGGSKPAFLLHFQGSCIRAKNFIFYSYGSGLLLALFKVLLPFCMLIHFATGLWLTILSIELFRIFPSPRRKSLASFPDFASVPNRRRRCSFFNSQMNPHESKLRDFPGPEGSKGRILFYEERNYYQRDRQRDPDRDHGGKPPG